MFSRKAYLILVSLGLLALMFVCPVAPQVQRTTIFIQPDGTIIPANVPIQRNGDIYTFTDNVYDPILIQKSNITINGAGYSLIGPLNETQKEAQQVLGIGPNATVTIPYIIGIDFDEKVNGATIKNLNVNWFSIGIYIRTMDNTLVGNGLVNNIVGVLLSGSTNNITMNYIKNNRQGLFFGFEQVNGSAANIPSDIKIYDNSFVTNEMQLSGCVCKVYNFTEAIHSWEYNGHGNYWSDYNGTDADHNGIGDTYYEIDPLNYDPNPLLASPAIAPTPPAQFPTTIIVAAVIAFVIAVLAVMLILRRKRA
jgi:hypothetical protein